MSNQSDSFISQEAAGYAKAGKSNEQVPWHSKPIKDGVHTSTIMRLAEVVLEWQMTSSVSFFFGRSFLYAID